MAEIFVGNIVVGTDDTENLTKPDWAIVVENGKIVASGQKKEILDRYSGNVRELGPLELLMPGFIDAHLHAPQFKNIGNRKNIYKITLMKLNIFCGPLNPNG